MSPQTQAVLAAALELPEAERALLVEHLLDSLPDDLEQLSDDVLLAELELRRAESEKDPSLLKPWSDVESDA